MALTASHLHQRLGLQFQWRAEKRKFHSLRDTTSPLFQDEKASQAFLSAFLLEAKLFWAKNSPRVGNHCS